MNQADLRVWGLLTNQKESDSQQRQSEYSVAGVRK
jgi:hypothetical protein